MRRARPTAAIWTMACLAAAALASSTVPDLRLVAGQSAQGEIAFDGEEDRVAVDLTVGEKLTFTAKASKKSPLHPVAAVYDAAGNAQTILPANLPAPKPTSAGIVNWPAPATGTYLLGIGGSAGGATGLYDLTTKAKAAPAPKFAPGTFATANEVGEFAFDAFAGTSATLTLKRGKKSTAVPRVLAVIAPDGTSLSLAGVSRKSGATSDLIKGLALPQFGGYKVRVQGNAGTTGAYTFAVSLKAPAVPKTKLDFRGASGGEATAGPVTSLEITPSAPTLDVGKTVQLLAKATYADGRVRDGTRVVTWASRAPRVATAANGATPGLATGVAAGGATLQAWAGAVEAREALTLVGGATVTGVTVVPAAPTVAPGDAISLQATATLSTNSSLDATSAADWAAVGGVAVTLVGPRVTGGGASGTAQITASLGGATSPSRDVTVTSRRVDRIVVSPAYKEIASGSQAFTATATYSDGTTADVTSSAAWASDNLAAATTSGATATFVAPGTAGIRATLDGVSSREAILDCGPVALSSVVVNVIATVPHGATRSFTADGTFADGGTRDVTEAATWSSDAAANVSVATTPGIRGQATGLADSGAATITASVVTGGGTKSGHFITAAASAERTSLVVVPRDATLDTGGAVTLHAFAKRSDGTFEDVTSSATWTSSNPAAATVAGGVVTDVAAGGTAIAASLSGMTAHGIVLTRDGYVAGVAVSGPGALAVGAGGKATARVTFDFGAGGNPTAPADVSDRVAWFSSDPVAWPVDATDFVAERRASPTNLVAALNGIASSAFAPTLVVGAQPTSLRVFPQSAHAVAGADVQLAAQATASDGSVVDVAAASAWNSETTAKATVDGTGLVHAVAKGTSRVTATYQSTLSDTETFATSLDLPSIASVVSPALVRGTSGNVVTINGAGLDGPNAVVTFGGTGVTADAAPTPSADGSSATVPVSVSGAAAPGAHDVTYTTSLGFSTKTGGLTVANTPPTIASISPVNIDVPGSGSTQTTLTVTGTGYASGDTFSLGTLSGVSLSNVQFVNATTLTGTVTVQSGTSKARLDVTVMQSAAGGGQTATLTGALKIGPVDPTVTSFAPTYAQLYPHTVSGQIVGTNFGSGIAASFANASSAVTNVSFTWQSSTSITFHYDVLAAATPGAYDLVLQNPSDIARTFSGLLVVAPGDPTVTAFSAPSLSRGVSNVAVEVDGTNFRTGDAVSASGTGVSFSSVTIASAEKITATVSVAAGATISLRDVTVTHPASLGGRGGTLTAAFRVTDSSPTVTSCNPSHIGRTGSSGPTRRVPIVVTGTNFSVGAGVMVTASGGSGLTVVANSTSVLSDTQIALSLDVAGAATVGNWDVTVTNPGSLGNSGATGAAKIVVTSETTLTVNRVVASTGSAQGGTQVTVYGAGFARGLVVDFGTERASGAQFIDQDTAVCTVPPPANPASSSSTSNSTSATTLVNVKVTNPGGASATLTGGFGYLANATAFKILASVPALSSSGVAPNLKSAVVRLSDYANTSTPHVGTSIASQQNPSFTDSAWFQAGSNFVNGQTIGFGADRRFMVFSRTGGGSLTSSATYVLQTSTSVKSAAGAPLVPANAPMSQTYDQWSFTLGTTTDSAAPTLSSSVPAASATGVPTNASVALTFGKEIDPLTVTASTITVSTGGNGVACAIAMSPDLKTITLTPYAELATSTTYTVTISSTVADLFGNASSISPRTFTTGSGVDSTAPTIDSVVIEQLPSNMDGSTTYVAGTDTPSNVTNSTQSFHVYMPRFGWTVAVSYSDAGGSGIDETQFSAKASVASGSSSANAELASKFDVTSTGATWTIASSDALATGDNVTLTFVVKDKAGNTSTSSVVTVNVVDATSNAVGTSNSPGGDLDPFNSLDTWVLRFDRDVYTASLSTTGTPPNATQQATTSAAANGVLDLEEALRISGLATANMTTNAANAVNGPSTGTNAIVMRLLEERIRATLRPRYGIAEDGTRGADSMNIEFLLPGEQGSLSAMPTWSTSSNFATGKAFSEMDIGGDTGPNSNPTSYYTTIGLAFLDPRNRNHEADVNDGGAAGSNEGIFAINMAKAAMNSSTTGSTWGTRVLAHFQTAKGGTPIGEGSLDDVVLAGSYDRTSSSPSNTQAMKDRYDQIMDAIEASALSVSSVTAHEIGHSLGLVADAGPKTGCFGNAPHTNTFTEAIPTFPNTSGHLNYLGNDIMTPASSVDQRLATGTDFMKFSPYDRDYLLRRQVYDEGR